MLLVLGMQRKRALRGAIFPLQCKRASHKAIFLLTLMRFAPLHANASSLNALLAPVCDKHHACPVCRTRVFLMHSVIVENSV